MTKNETPTKVSAESMVLLLLRSGVAQKNIKLATPEVMASLRAKGLWA